MKRFLALFLMLACLLPVLAGCPTPDDGGGTTTTTTTSPDSEPQNPDSVEMTFRGDFTIHGEDAALLEDALEYTKVEPAQNNAAKKIYVGEADAAIVTKAKELLATRENNFADFALCSNET